MVCEKVIIVDDDSSVCTLLKLLLRGAGHEVVAMARSGEEALSHQSICSATLMILDMDMPRMEGLTVLRRMREYFPEVRVLVLSGLDPEIYALRCMRLGAVGFLDKGAGVELLPIAIQRLYSGQMLFPHQLVNAKLRYPSFSDRELVLLRCMGRGGDDFSIASALGISHVGVKVLFRKLQNKAGLLTRADISRYAQDLKLG